MNDFPINWLRQTAAAELFAAEKALARSKCLLAEHELRVAAKREKGVIGPNSQRLLDVMRKTYELQVQHVATLKREIKRGY